MDTLLIVSRIEVVTVNVLAVTTVLLYAKVSPAWKKTPFGVALFSVIAMFALALTVTSLTVVFGVSPWTIVLRAVGYFILVVAFTILCTSIVVIQERAYRAYIKKEKENGQVDS